MFARAYNDIVNFLSFTNGLRDLRKKVNLSIDLPEIIIHFPNSHPRGFIKEFKKRRTTIVESYLQITKNLESISYNERIDALRLLAEHITYSRSLKMPLNTARVQLALMKAVVKNRDNKRVQLELMRDFTVSSFGHPRDIRRFLNKFDIIEVPETGEELKDLKMGWDFHVHDNTSYGLKTPMQLIIDAFIKGISELTVVYTDLDNEEAILEVLEAGKILGIRVNIALEFSAITNGYRFHYIYILPNFSSNKNKFKKFLKEKSKDFKEFLNELEENYKKRRKTISLLIENFNTNHLPKINNGYAPDSIYYLEPLSINDDINYSPIGIFSHRQLGELLYPRLEKVLKNRALYATSIKNRVDNAPELFTSQEIELINTEFEKVRSQYRDIDPEKVRLEYFADSESLVPDSEVSSLEDIYNLAKKSEGTIKFIQPLEHGLQAAIDVILSNCSMFSHTEIFNIYDTIEAKEDDFILFTKFIRLLNQGQKAGLAMFFKENKLCYDDRNLEKALEYLKNNTLIPAIGSDATGRSTLAPGMGFVFENRLPKHQRKYFKKRHYNMPNEVSDLVYKLSKVQKTPLKTNEKPNIICLGKVNSTKKNLLGDEKVEKPISPLRAWTYLNPAIRNFIFILIGFIPAYFTVGIEFACLWMVITGSRNMFVDVISSNGLKPNDWHYQDINWTNLAHSLFWTGFSVPILGFVKLNFDALWSWQHDGAEYELVKFFFINTTNGIYLATHNYIRGFDKVTIRANLFRSIIAWPFATLFSPVGNAIGIPSIVQAKFWSDFVASIIEGSGKYKNILKLKDNIMQRLLPELHSDDEETVNLAILDLIYFIDESPRAKTAFMKQVMDKKSFWENFKESLKVHKKKGLESNHLYYTIKRQLTKNDRYNELTEYIITHYNREHSIYLLQLLSSNYDSITNLLNKTD